MARPRSKIERETGFHPRFWAAWTGVHYLTVMKYFRESKNTMHARMARRKSRQQWCKELAKEAGITVGTAANYGSREKYWHHILVKQEYETTRMSWFKMEQQWGKQEWKESEVRRSRDRKWRKHWLAKCKVENRPFILTKKVRTNINRRLRNKIKRGLSGAGYRAFDAKKTIEHIQSQFLRGMTWDNWGKEWEIDHIVPLAKFDLSLPAHVKQSNHWTNLRPLWKLDNRRKGAKGGGQLCFPMPA